jgi:hypothetical protein
MYGYTMWLRCAREYLNHIVIAATARQQVWLLLDADTREIIGVYIDVYSEAAAHKLLEFLRPIYCLCTGPALKMEGDVLSSLFLDVWLGRQLST